MARIRSIHPGFAKSEDIASLSKLCRLHFALLWTYADDHGRGKDDARLIKAECWPLDADVTVKKVEGWQAELAKAGRILRYDVGGRRYFQVQNWSKYQHPQRPRDSEYPAPTCPGDVPDASRTRTGHVLDGAGKHPRRVSLGEGEGEGVGDMAPVEPARKRPPDLLFEAVATTCGIDWRNGMTDRARQALNAAVGDLRSAGADPSDVPLRAGRYRLQYRTPLTPNALAKHWPQLAHDRQPAYDSPGGWVE